MKVRILWLAMFALVLGGTVYAQDDDYIPNDDYTTAGFRAAVAPASVDDITVSFSLLNQESFRKPGQRMELSLQDAIDVAMDLNPQIRGDEHGLQSSLANLDLTESNYRSQFDLTGQADENYTRRRGGGSFRLDPELGLISTTSTQSDNSETLTVGPSYRRQFRDGSSFTFEPDFTYVRDTELGFDINPSSPRGKRQDVNSNFRFQYDMPLNSKQRVQIETDIENSKLNVVQSDYDLFRRRKLIREAVISNYWRIKEQQEAILINRERLVQAKKIEFILRVQYENENVAQVDVSQAQVDVMNNEAQLIQQEGSLRSQIENFNIVLGVPIETDLVLTDPIDIKPLPMAADKYVEMVTSTNLDLKSVRLSIQQSLNSLRSASLGQQPDLTFSAFYNRDDEANETGGLGLFFRWPIGDGGATKARVRAQKERLEQLRINLWDLERQLVQETYQDLRNLQLQDQRIAILKQNVREAQITYENANIMFREFGRITFREMQDVQVDLARNRNDLNSAKVSYNIAKANLMEKVHDYQPTESVDPLLDVVLQDPNKKSLDIFYLNIDPDWLPSDDEDGGNATGE